MQDIGPADVCCRAAMLRSDGGNGHERRNRASCATGTSGGRRGAVGLHAASHEWRLSDGRTRGAVSAHDGERRADCCVVYLFLFIALSEPLGPQVEDRGREWQGHATRWAGCGPPVVSISRSMNWSGGFEKRCTEGPRPGRFTLRCVVVTKDSTGARSVTLRVNDAIDGTCRPVLFRVGRGAPVGLNDEGGEVLPRVFADLLPAVVDGPLLGANRMVRRCARWAVVREHGGRDRNRYMGIDAASRGHNE